MAEQNMCRMTQLRLRYGNKAWKAISNALKGRVVADDDQYSLGVCLLSRRSSEAECHIYVLPVQDAGDFFFLRSDQYPFSR